MRVIFALFLLFSTLRTILVQSEIIDLFKYKEGQRFFLTSDDNGNLQMIDLHMFDLDFKFDPETELFFRLYTRKNPEIYQEITLGDRDGLINSNYNKSNELKVFIHGWGSNANSNACYRIRDAFLLFGDVNVICLDWSIPAGAFYTTSVKHAPVVGSYLAKFIDWIVGEGSEMRNLHIMGHSLGGHIAGIAGRSVNSGKVSYITGLDPALPLWGEGSQRIRTGDAEYVEVIHTNGGSLGLEVPVGDNDFYPNGGKFMPGCLTIDLRCSHGRSVAYFAESIDHEEFMAQQCENLDEISNDRCSNLSRLHMGGARPKNAMGLFYLKTNANSPYHQG